MAVPPDKIHARNIYDPVVRYMGAWDAITIYSPGDLVTSAGSAYLFIYETDSGHAALSTPAPAPPDTTYWLAL